VPVRTTYRTTRVLCAIGDSPGLSNREIAEAAGLADEGQTSKLLRRLERRGLVENFGIGQTYGGPNAWSLTAYGEHVREATRHSLVPGAGAVAGRRVRGPA
jgi:DNA-binding IclR family transcriptional regulator